MPKSPLDSFFDGIEKIQEVHIKAERLRQNLDRIDPLEAVTDTVSDISDKINRLDSVLAKTRRRTRRTSPKQG